MIVTSKDYSPLFIKYPILKWINKIILIPILAVIYLVLPALFILFLFGETNKFGWIILIMILFSYLIPYLHVREGKISKQILSLHHNNLIVTNRWFLVKHTKYYTIQELKIEEINAWNLFTGDSINLSFPYARLIINKSIKLWPLYKKEELEKLINEFSSNQNLYDKRTHSFQEI